MADVAPFPAAASTSECLRAHPRSGQKPNIRAPGWRLTRVVKSGPDQPGAQPPGQPPLQVDFDATAPTADRQTILRVQTSGHLSPNTIAAERHSAALHSKNCRIVALSLGRPRETVMLSSIFKIARTLAIAGIIAAAVLYYFPDAVHVRPAY